MIWDYCCGGKQTLAAARSKELDVEVIEAELAKLAEQPIEKDWRSAAGRNHRPYHRALPRSSPQKQLPELILQATKVGLRSRRLKPSVPKG